MEQNRLSHNAKLLTKSKDKHPSFLLKMKGVQYVLLLTVSFYTNLEENSQWDLQFANAVLSYAVNIYKTFQGGSL